MKKIIAKTIQAAKTDSRQGFILPLYIYNENSDLWQKLNNPSLEFPNKGNVFVYKDYDILADANEYETHFFIDVEEADNFRPEEPLSARYKASQSNARNPDDYELCEIIEVGNFNPSNLTFQYNDKLKPDNHHIFIKAQENIYGPFDRSAQFTKEKDEYIISLKGLIENRYCIYAFNMESINSELLLLDSLTYVANSIDLIKKYKKNIIGVHYFGEIKELLDWGKRRFDIDEITEKNLEIIIKKLETFNIDEELESQKINSLLKILNNSIDWFNNRLPNFVFRYFDETDKGSSFLNAYMQTNSSFIQDTYNSELQKINTEINQRKEELSKLDTDKLLLGNLNESEQSFIKKLLANPENIRKLSEFDNIDERYWTTKAWNDIEEKRRDNLENSIKQLTEEDRKLKTSFFELKTELSKDDVVSSQLLKIKAYTEILNGISWLNNESNDKELEVISPPSIRKSSVTLKEYIIEIQNSLKAINRDVSYNDLANYLITINQSFLTVFAGLPGAGKTSLITQIAQASGLETLFTSVSVARGWTSGKDLIGYYNPISQRFQSASTGLYEGLNRHEQFENSPYWVLLDEANLSPIEHYWSDFMKFSDPESDKILTIRENPTRLKEFKLKEGFKFIATINYDHTTEVLSPRLIDRAPIVLLDAPDYSSFNYINIEQKPESVNEMLGNDSIKELFYSKHVDLSKDERTLFENLLNILKDDSEEYGLPIVVSPRKIKAFYQYCSVANTTLEKGGNQFTAFDYATAQYILPLLEGRGESYQRRLEKLLYEVKQLPITSKRLQRIIQYGKLNYDNYRFFS